MHRRHERGREPGLSGSGKLERRYTKRATATRAFRLLATGVVVLPVTAGLMVAGSEAQDVSPAAASRSAVVGPASTWERSGVQVVIRNPKAAPTTTTTTVAPTTTTTTTVAPTTTTTTTVAPPPVATTRQAWLWPFSSDSPWNLPVGSGATFEGPSGPMTSQLRASTIRSKDGASVWNVIPWVNADTYSHPVYKATTADPRVLVTQPWGDPEWAHIPADATPAKGWDRHLHVVQPDGRTIVEMWNVEKTASGWNAGRIEVVDLHSDGLGPDNGTRAYGGSAVGGLIRRWEVDPTDPNYTDGVIRHAIALALPAGMLKHEGGVGGYDANGYGTARGYVWPATEQDYDSSYSYYGAIPMGTFVAIPKTVDVDSLGLSPATRAVAQALQDYGGYVTDRSGGNTIALYAEPTVPSSWFATVTGPSWTAKELDAIRQTLQVVTNSGPATVGGGGTRPTAAPPLR